MFAFKFKKMRITSTLLPVFLTQIVSAQNRITDTSATCIAFWKKGESKKYKIIHSKEKGSSNEQKNTTTSSYEALIKVIDSTETSFTIEWTYKNFTITGVAENTLTSLNALMEGQRIVYKTDDVGMFSELVNWQEIRDFALKTYENTIQKKSNNKEFIAALSQIKTIFNSKENIEALLIKEVQLFHSPYGIEYGKIGNIVETELPNVTGGKPFPAKIIIKLDKLIEKDNFCQVSINQKIDKNKAGPIMIDMLKKLSNKPISDEARMKKEIQNLEISDENSYKYYISSGWINNFTFRRTSNIMDMSQIETYIFTEVK
jgi:hypothetical protein